MLRTQCSTNKLKLNGNSSVVHTLRSPKKHFRLLHTARGSECRNLWSRCIMAAPSPANPVDLFLLKPLDVNALAASLEVPASERESIMAEFLSHNFKSAPVSPQNATRTSAQHTNAQELPRTRNLSTPTHVEAPASSKRARRSLNGLLLRRNQNV